MGSWNEPDRKISPSRRLARLFLKAVTEAFQFAEVRAIHDTSLARRGLSVSRSERQPYSWLAHRELIVLVSKMLLQKVRLKCCVQMFQDLFSDVTH